MTPVEKGVDAVRDGVVVEDEEFAVRAQRRDDAGRPPGEVVEVAEHTLAGIDEVEPPAPQLAGQRLRVPVHPEDLRPPLTRRLERRRSRVDAGRDGSEPRERGGRLAGAAVEVEDALAL